MGPPLDKAMEFFLNVLTEFSEFRDKQYLSLKLLEPPTSYVREKDAQQCQQDTYETGSLN